MIQPIIIQNNIQGGKIVAIKPLLLEPEPILPIKVNELLEPVYSSCSGKTKIKVGDIRHSNNYGEYIVIEDLGTKVKSKVRWYKVQFLETGYVGDFNISNIYKNIVKDTFKRNVSNVGYYGTKTRTDELSIILYDIWHDLIVRCYSPKQQKYQNYGGKGIHVCQRWHNFSNFHKDVQLLQGWRRKLENWKAYSLDKDILFASNCYSPTTCMWANKEEQSFNTTQNKMFSAISPSGNKEYFMSSSNLVKIYPSQKLNRQNITSCLLGLRNTHKGWSNFQPIIPPNGYVLRWWKKENPR